MSLTLFISPSTIHKAVNQFIYLLVPHSDHVTSTTPQCVGIIHTWDNPGHLTLWYLQVVPVVYASDVIPWKNMSDLECTCSTNQTFVHHICSFSIYFATKHFTYTLLLPVWPCKVGQGHICVYFMYTLLLPVWLCKVGQGHICVYFMYTLLLPIWLCKVGQGHINHFVTHLSALLSNNS